MIFEWNINKSQKGSTINAVANGACPECGSPVQHVEGCVILSLKRWKLKLSPSIFSVTTNGSFALISKIIVLNFME